MAMSVGADSADTGGIDAGNPGVALMQQWGRCRKELVALASKAPKLASGIQDVINAFEAVIPQQVADIVSGNPPGSSGSGLAGGTPAAPTAPSVQTGMP